MHLSPEEIAAAETCGVSFIPASPAQVQRLAMQRKVFYRAGEPILATRGDGFYETSGTLQRLITEGLRQRGATGVPAPVAAPDPVPEVSAAEPPALPKPPPMVPAAEPAAAEPPAALADDAVAPLPAAVPEATARRPRRKARTVVATAPWSDRMAEAEAEAEPPVAAPEIVPPRRAPSPAADPAGGTADARGARWRVAGAARRGRAGKHWSTRQRKA